MKTRTIISKAWFRHSSMRTKMTMSYAIPLLAIALVLSIISYKIISLQYARQIVYSANQSYEQAISYLENHVQNMNYVQLLMGSNKQLNEVLREGVFELEESADQYREYWKLDEIIISIDLSNGLYNCALYVPDTLIYANNNYHFYPISQLPDIQEWDYFSSAMGGAVYFTDAQDVLVGNSAKPVKQVALLKTIYDRNGIQCIARVSVAVQELENILKNSDITKKGFSYLINNREEIIVTSNQEDTHYIQIAEDNKTFPEGKEEWKDIKYGNKGDYLVRRQTIEGAGWTLVSLIDKEDFYQESNVVLQVFAMFVLVIFPAVVLISYNLARYYTKRLTFLSSQMTQLQNGDWSIMEKVEEESDEIGRLLSQFTYMTQELRNLMIRQYKLGQSVKSAELKALQAQINPHFLYNTLDLINWEARDHGADEIVTIVQSLAKFYRISLNKGRQMVKIADELEHVRAYVNIENYHFEGAITLDLKVDERVLEQGCINIILQPLVENAIMHGIAKDSSIKSCHIIIEVIKDNRDIVFLIRDNGPGMTKEEMEQILQKNTYTAAHGYGAQNINFRIKLYYGEQYGISYESEVGIGTCVTVRIPGMSLEEAEQLGI